jgi:hypothetical protein
MVEAKQLLRRRPFNRAPPRNPTIFGSLGTPRSLSKLVLPRCLGCVKTPIPECGGCGQTWQIVVAHTVVGHSLERSAVASEKGSRSKALQWVLQSHPQARTIDVGAQADRATLVLVCDSCS